MEDEIAARRQIDQHEFMWNVHSYINENIRFADTKAQFVIGWTTVVTGALVAAGFFNPNPITLGEWSRLLGLLGLFAGIACAVIALAPRLQTRQSAGYIYWLNILGHNKREQFVQAVNALGAHDAGNHIACHLYDLAETCRNKYWWVSVSILLASLGGVGSTFMYFFKI